MVLRSQKLDNALSLRLLIREPEPDRLTGDVRDVMPEVQIDKARTGRFGIAIHRRKLDRSEYLGDPSL
jgi:hypothetical protein